METKNKLSVLILTYNEERCLRETLEKIDFADEIIVLDSFSTDSTLDIIKSFPQVTLYQNKFVDFATQRNLAISYSKNDWVFVLDADERITPELRNEIITLLNSNPQAVAYSMPIKFMFKDYQIKYTGTQHDYLLRLFNKNYCKYITNKLVHEKLEINGETGKLKNIVLHYTYYDYNIFKNKVIFYGKLKAKEKHNKGKKYNVFMHFLHPLYTFISYYFLKFGFVDGIPGLILSYLFSYSVYARYSELKRLQS